MHCVWIIKKKNESMMYPFNEHQEVWCLLSQASILDGLPHFEKVDGLRARI